MKLDGFYLNPKYLIKNVFSFFPSSVGLVGGCVVFNILRTLHCHFTMVGSTRKIHDTMVRSIFQAPLSFFQRYVTTNWTIIVGGGINSEKFFLNIFEKIYLTSQKIPLILLFSSRFWPQSHFFSFPTPVFIMTPPPKFKFFKNFTKYP